MASANRKHARMRIGKGRNLAAAAAAAAVGALAAGGASAGAGADGPVAQASGPVKVSMRDDFFAPGLVKVRKGDLVKWVNRGSAVHNATFGGGGTGDLDPGEARKLKFGKVGRFKYTCTIHDGMKGTVKVRPRG
jgi:plastocyanin